MHLSMPRRIILPPTAARDRLSCGSNASVRVLLDLWGLPLLSVGAFYWRTWLTPTQTAFLILLSAFGIICLALKRKNGSVNRSRLPAVALYPIGLQLCTIPSSSTENPISSRITPVLFFPREIVLDCVVAEIVYSYKVESIVALRVCEESENKTWPPSENGSATRLVDVFPNVNMTYMECMAVRSQINEYLRDS